MMPSTVYAEIVTERERQEEKWGQQNHPDGTGDEFDSDLFWAYMSLVHEMRELSERMTQRCQNAHDDGEGTWEHIMTEEWAEVLAAKTPEDLRKELIQLNAVTVAWIEAIDRRPR